jgi:hypothetical protein
MDMENLSVASVNPLDQLPVAPEPDSTFLGITVIVSPLLPPDVALVLHYRGLWGEPRVWPMPWPTPKSPPEPEPPEAE